MGSGGVDLWAESRRIGGVSSRQAFSTEPVEGLER